MDTKPNTSASASELMDELAAPTPEKHPGGRQSLDIADDAAQPSAAPRPDPLFIEPGHWPEDEGTGMSTGKPGGAAARYSDDAPDPEGPADEPLRLTPETTTELYIGALDFLQTQLFKSIELYKARRRIEKADTSGRDPKAAYTHALQLIDELSDYGRNLEDLPISDQAKVRIMQRATLRIEKLPFTDAEFDKMAEALELIIKEMPAYQLPPSFGFALAVGHALLPRAIDAVFE